MRRNRNVKIVATLGPSSSDYDMIKALFEAGADVFRLNMSHGNHEDIAARHATIRQIEAETGRPIAILADLQGPKLRCGTFADGPHDLAGGQVFRFDLDPAPGDATRVCLPHPEIFAALKPGATLLVNDGKIRLVVDRCGPEFAECTVTAGGMISNRKGVNVPDVVLPLAALSPKDRRDLEFVCALGVDWLALSFVQRPADVQEARALARGRAAILSKIEKPAAVEAFNEILAVSDGIMVARGDLGVELPVHAVPPIQKRIGRRCRAAAKPVIIATQMLESMIESPMPTRAEVSDVATAIYEGADAVMLSAESAAGKYPVEAVRTMDAVAIEVESDPTYRQVISASRNTIRGSHAESMVSAAREVAETTGLKAISCFTQTGSSALLVARERSSVPLIAMTQTPEVARRLCLSWGTYCVMTGQLDRFRTAVVNGVKAALDHGFARREDFIAVLAGVPFNTKGTTNILRIAPCEMAQIINMEEEAE